MAVSYTHLFGQQVDDAALALIAPVDSSNSGKHNSLFPFFFVVYNGLHLGGQTVDCLLYTSLHTGHHLFHDLHAPHELFRTGNVGFADIVSLCNLLADARFRRGGCLLYTSRCV